MKQRREAVSLETGGVIRHKEFAGIYHRSYLRNVEFKSRVGSLLINARINIRQPTFLSYVVTLLGKLTRVTLRVVTI